MRMLIMGPPGAGKGTQGAEIAKEFGIAEISTGAIFRSNVADKTELGLQVAAIMEKGEYVPDEVTIKLVEDRLSQPDVENGFLLDGFPRTVAQAESLDEFLTEQGRPLDAVLSLVVDGDVLVQRMMKRASIEGRADDNEETIRRRFEVYTQQTEPLLALYRAKNLVVEVNGLGSVAEVHQRILAALKAKQG